MRRASIQARWLICFNSFGALASLLSGQTHPRRSKALTSGPDGAKRVARIELSEIRDRRWRPARAVPGFAFAQPGLRAQSVQSEDARRASASSRLKSALGSVPCRAAPCEKTRQSRHRRHVTPTVPPPAWRVRGRAGGMWGIMSNRVADNRDNRHEARPSPHGVLSGPSRLGNLGQGQSEAAQPAAAFRGRPPCCSKLREPGR
jgi:hypothetical protein